MILASLLAADLALRYSMAAFDCIEPGLFGPDCADAARLRIAWQGLPIFMAWGLALWLFVRERKKR